MKSIENIEVAVVTSIEKTAATNIEQTIFELDNQIKMLSSEADKLDYLLSVGSGVLCGMLDILWVGDFDLAAGRNVADDKVNDIVKKTAKLLGCKDDDIKSCVTFLEKKFPIPADGNTPDFGGGLQHHLRDFAHHPTIVGLVFSLLTQFTEMSYGTDVTGNFMVVPVPEKSKIYIGSDVPDKLLKGTLIWFFHLVSDIAGSSSTAGITGGTGIPGPILSMAKELSVLPLFKNIKVEDNSVSVFLSKLFNGTLWAKHDENGKIIRDTVVKFDLRGEIGVAVELGKQAIPVVANECFIRAFYFVRRFAMEIKSKKICSFEQLSDIDWDKVKPYKNPTITRMLTISTSVFTVIDVSEAIATQKYWVSVNYIGVGRFVVALGSETVNFLKVRNVARVKQMYQTIEQNTYMCVDDRIYERLGAEMNLDKLGLDVEQTEILYNLEYYKTLHDIDTTTMPVGKDKIVFLKQGWLDEWKHYMESGFADFVQTKNAELHWYSEAELIQKAGANEPNKPWLRLVLLEAMLFEPYYPLSLEKDKNGNDIPSKRYDALKVPLAAFRKKEGDNYLDSFFPNDFCQSGYVKRLRKCYGKVSTEMNEVLKTVITSLSVTAVITAAVLFTAGAFAPAIATVLVGSQFAGLSGAALTSACLAYLGGGAIAAGGLGMAGGTAAIVGGGAILGIGVGAGVGGAVGAVGLMGKKATIQQSAKLMVSVREIFLNDEHDLAYSDTIYEQYVEKITEIEKGLVELRLKADVASKDEKKKLKLEISNAEESVPAMKIARKSMLKYKSSFELGVLASEKTESNAQ